MMVGTCRRATRSFSQRGTRDPRTPCINAKNCVRPRSRRSTEHGSQRKLDRLPSFRAMTAAWAANTARRRGPTAGAPLSCTSWTAARAPSVSSSSVLERRSPAAQMPVRSWSSPQAWNSRTKDCNSSRTCASPEASSSAVHSSTSWTSVTGNLPSAGIAPRSMIRRHVTPRKVTSNWLLHGRAMSCTSAPTHPRGRTWAFLT
mmetsp:Transcript_33956/g.93987  ORF Transcript_33956/g.93987 Transcript_33956/m.93987 type:complete len:202 (+) Transcript_33956:110-715(+)